MKKLYYILFRLLIQLVDNNIKYQYIMEVSNWNYISINLINLNLIVKFSSKGLNYRQF